MVGITWWFTCSINLLDTGLLLLAHDEKQACCAGGGETEPPVADDQLPPVNIVVSGRVEKKPAEGDGDQ